MNYCDTSLLVALIVDEVNSAIADRWMRAQPPGSLAASVWVGTEMASALALKHRLGQIDDAAHARTLRAADRLLFSLRPLAIETRHFVDARRLVSTPPHGLRSGDALHLALVIGHDVGLATLDRHLADAARHIGVTVADLVAV